MGYIKGFEDKYPKELVDVRMNIEGSVIGLLAKDLLIIDDSNIKVTDFKSEEGRIYYKVLRDIRKKGFVSLDESTLLANLSGDILEKFDNVGGYDQLYNLSTIVDVKNSESILDNLQRENILLNLYDKGFGLLKPMTDDNGKEYIPLNKFRKMNSENIISFYEIELNKYAIGYTTKILEEGKLLITPEYIEQIRNGELNGVPFEECGIDVEGNTETVYPYLSRDIKGLIRGSTTILGAYSSVGKTSYWTGLLLSLIESGEKILIFSNEQDSSVFRSNFIVWLAYKHFRYFEINKTKLKNSDFSDKDNEMLDEIAQYYNDNYADNIMFVHLPDMDINTIKKKTRHYALKEGYSVVLVDTLKQDYTDGTADASYHKLVQDTRSIDAMCKRYNLIGLCSFQLAPSTLGKLFLDVTCLSGAKAVKDTLENLFLMRIVYPEELISSSKNYCKPFQWKKVDERDKDGKMRSVWKQIPYEITKENKRLDKIYRMLFVDKCRSGTMSGDSGIAQLLEFDAIHCVFKEVAYCKPKRGIIS